MWRVKCEDEPTRHASSQANPRLTIHSRSLDEHLLYVVEMDNNLTKWKGMKEIKDSGRIWRIKKEMS